LFPIVRNPRHTPDFDCNGDGKNDVSDADCATSDKLGLTLDAAHLLVGDADGDGEVAFPDFQRLAQNFGTAAPYTGGDFDKSGDVRFPDFVILANNFGKTSAATAAVPEPVAAYTFWVLGVLLAAIRRGR
jgi:hypothetical protein